MQSKRLRSLRRLGTLGIVSALIGGLLPGVGVSTANAVIDDPTVTTTTAGTTSIPTTMGKARGSGLWGYVGDIETRNAAEPGRGSAVYSYGVGVNPVDGSVWVTDSAKLCYGSFAAFLCSGQNTSTGSTYLRGIPRVFKYELEQADWSAGNYTNDGGYSVVAAGENAGIGANWQKLSDRTSIVTGSTGALGGPRGISFTAAGDAWVLDSDYGSPFLTSADAKHAVRVFAPSGTEGASFGRANWAPSTAWANRHAPDSFDYPVGIARMADGNMVATSQTPELLKVYQPDGTFVRNIYLHQPANTAFNGDLGFRSPYAVAVDPSDGTILVGYIDPGSGRPSHIERVDPSNCTTETVGNPAGSSRDVCAVLDTIGGGTLASGNGNNATSSAATFSIAVDPLTRDIYVSQRNGTPYVFASDGTSKGRFTGFGTGTVDGQVGTTVRGITFDERGFMYVTTAEGTANTRVQIFARTPDPITGAKAMYTDASLTEATVSWDALPTGSTAEGKTELRDYTLEIRDSSDDGATWSPWAVSTKGAASTSATRTLTGLDPTKTYEVRIAGWNEAGNGDTAVVPLAFPPSPLTVVKTGNGVANESAADALQVEAGSAVSFEYTVTNNGPSPVTDVELNDSVLGDLTAPAGFDGTLAAAGDSVTFTATGPVAAGAYQNTATATGVSAGEDIDATDIWYGFGVTRGLTIVKTGNGTVATATDDAVDVAAGSDVVFNYTVTNTGNVPVTGLVLEDSELGVLTAPDGFDGTLSANGGSVTFTATGPVAAGAYVNIAEATGTSAGVAVDADTEWHGFGVTTDLSVVKTGNNIANESADGPLYVDAGSTVQFGYTIHNGGNAPVTIDSVTDSVLGEVTTVVSPADFTGTLAAGASATFQASGPVAAGAYANTVAVEATTELGGELTASDDWFGFGVTTGLTVVKTGNGEAHPDAEDAFTVAAGSLVEFGYTVHNTSNVPVTLSSVIDTVTGPATAPTDFTGTLGVDETVIYTSNGQIPAGDYTNTVNITATATGGAQLTAADTWHGFGVTTGLTVVKTGNGVTAPTADAAHHVAAGTSVKFRYTITNTGNATVQLTKVLDSVLGEVSAPAGFAGVLEPGASVTYETAGVVPEGAYQNDVTVTATESLLDVTLTAKTSWFGHGDKKPIINPDDPGTSDPNGDNHLSNTGTDPNTALIGGVLAAFLIGAGILLTVRRSHRNHEAG